jgi:hypothetical protein
MKRLGEAIRHMATLVPVGSDEQRFYASMNEGEGAEAGFDEEHPVTVRVPIWVLRAFRDAIKAEQ